MSRGAITKREVKARLNSPGDAVQMEPRSKIWIGKNGDAVLGDWRVTLLEAIDRTGSLTKAAEELGIPYRSAWEKVRDSEDRLGIRLVVTRSGGADGGSSELTEAARDLVCRYRRFTDGLADLINERFREAFG